MIAETSILLWLQGTVNRRRTSRLGRRSQAQIQSVQQLEERSLLTVSFQFNYAGAIGSGIGFEAANGQVRRDALELAGLRLGAQFSETATISMGVISMDSPASNTLASAGTEFNDTLVNGFSSNEVVRTKILTGTDLNAAANDGTVEVNWGLNWEISPNPADVSGTEYDFLSTMYHELLHAVGWGSAISPTGADLNDAAPTGQAGAWRFYDKFITNVSGTPVINGTTFALNASSWNTNSIGGASPAAGLFFNGTNARAANGNAPVGLFTPDPWQVGSSVSHLDDQNPLLQPLMMASATDFGPGARNLTTLERAVLKDLGYTLVAGGITVTQTGGSTIVSESGTTDTFNVVLSRQPLSNVVLNVSSGNLTEATVNKATLTFTPVNWNVAQTVTVTGVDDAVVDGTQITPVTVSVNAATSDDAYDAVANAVVSVSTLDNESLSAPVLNPVAPFPGAQPSLTWQPVAGATRYEVWFSRIFPNTSRIYLDSNVTTTSWSPPASLDPGQFRYWVRAFNASDVASPWSAAKNFQVRPTLTTPLAGSFTNPTTFQWNAIPFVSSYELFLRTSAGDQTITAIAATTYTPAAALPTGAIQWWIRATGFPGGINSGWSLGGNANTSPRAVVTGPTSPATTTPSFTWLSIPGAGKYVLHVELVSNPGVAVIRQNSLTTTEYTSPTPLASGSYRAWVKAITNATNSFATAHWSLPFNFTVAAVNDNPSPTAQDDSATLVSLRQPLSPVLAARSVHGTPPNQVVEIATASVDTVRSETEVVNNVSDVTLLPTPTHENSGTQNNSEEPLELQILDAVMGQSMLLTAMLD